MGVAAVTTKTRQGEIEKGPSEQTLDLETGVEASTAAGAVAASAVAAAAVATVTVVVVGVAVAAAVPVVPVVAVADFERVLVVMDVPESWKVLQRQRP